METKTKVPSVPAPSPEAAPANVATVMHAGMAAASASRNALALAADRVAKGKTVVEELAAAIRVEEQRKSGLKAQRSAAVDELEAALQAHDIAVLADQAARALPGA
jgi:hypothetical protein